MTKWKRQLEYDKAKKYIFSVGLMREQDADIIEYLEEKRAEGISRNSVVKDSLRRTIAEEEVKYGFFKEGEGACMLAESEPEYHAGKEGEKDEKG